MWTAVNQFSCRVGSFDKTVFLTRDVINAMTRHFHDIRCADHRYKNYETLSVSLAYLLSQSLTQLLSGLICSYSWHAGIWLQCVYYTL